MGHVASGSLRRWIPARCRGEILYFLFMVRSCSCGQLKCALCPSSLWTHVRETLEPEVSSIMDIDLPKDVAKALESDLPACRSCGPNRISKREVTAGWSDPLLLLYLGNPWRSLREVSKKPFVMVFFPFGYLTDTENDTIQKKFYNIKPPNPNLNKSSNTTKNIEENYEQPAHKKENYDTRNTTQIVPLEFVLWRHG